MAHCLGSDAARPPGLPRSHVLPSFSGPWVPLTPQVSVWRSLLQKMALSPAGLGLVLTSMPRLSTCPPRSPQSMCRVPRIQQVLNKCL